MQCYGQGKGLYDCRYVCIHAVDYLVPSPSPGVGHVLVYLVPVRLPQQTVHQVHVVCVEAAVEGRPVVGLQHSAVGRIMLCNKQDTNIIFCERTTDLSAARVSTGRNTDIR